MPVRLPAVSRELLEALSFLRQTKNSACTPTILTMGATITIGTITNPASSTANKSRGHLSPVGLLAVAQVLCANEVVVRPL
jgi:hypothetical protein